MRPFLFHLGDIAIPSFFFMMMLGALGAAFYASWKAKRVGENPVVMLDLAIIGIVAAVIGGRLFHIFVEYPGYYWEDPMRVFYFWQGGFASPGSFLLGLVCFLFYLRWRKVHVVSTLDLAVTALPIVIFFVRIGCLLVGCCYGKPTDFFFHLVFNNPASTAGYYHLGEKLHATQVYLALNQVILFGLLQYVYHHRKFYGQVVATFLLYYGVSRFLIEFLRGDADRGVYFDGMISSGQIVLFIGMVAGLGLWTVWRKRYSLPRA